MDVVIALKLFLDSKYQQYTLEAYVMEQVTVHHALVQEYILIQLVRHALYLKQVLVELVE